MTQKNKVYKKIFFFYLILVCCAFALLTFLDITQKSEIVQKKSVQGFRVTEKISYQETEDDDAPAGIIKEYILNPGQIGESENCLAFYVVHHYVQVYIENELVYSLSPGENHTVSKTTGCEWAIVPLSEEDSDKDIKVILTPAYKSVSERQPEFLIGARQSILLGMVRDDICDLIMSVLAIGVGGVFIGIALFWLIQKKAENSLLYLGIFSAFLGLWKITDTRTMAMMFSEHALLLSQISLMALALCVVPFILFIENQIERKRWGFLNFVCVCSISVTLLQVVLQAAGLIDLRETLMVTHGVIALTLAAIISTVISQLHAKRSNRKLAVTCACFLLCTIGTIVDLVKYYLTGTSGGILNTIAISLFYIVVMGVMSIMDLTHEATIDFATGLFNRSCCNEKVHMASELQEGTCLIMFDLNQLKKINDTMGHEAGDEIIAQFAKILRQNVPGSAFLGRYGGDEFIAIMERCDSNLADKILRDISEGVEKYNASGHRTKMSFSAGYALSADYPGCTMMSLMSKADNKMYENKKAFYENLEKRS